MARHRRLPLATLRFPVLLLALILTSVAGEARADFAKAPYDGVSNGGVPYDAVRHQPASYAKADQVLVLKGERRLLLLRAGEVLRSYRVALGFNPQGPKLHQGDGRTPEGRYKLDWRNDESEYYRSIHVSYPSPADLTRARQSGLAPGGDIMIHGLPNGMDVIGPDHAKWDWTEGCIAVTNAEMDEIWSFVDDGTPIEIRP